MKIRKSFRYEMSHRVLNAFTQRCKNNIHGHSYTLELFLNGCKPDNAQMLMDFSYVKKYFGPFCDSFDHSHMVWDTPENKDEVEYIKSHNERWIVAPFSSTAEMQAKMFCIYAKEALANLQYHNLVDESVKVDSAIVHETTTGYAQYYAAELRTCQFPDIDLNTIAFSEGIKKEWSPEFTAFYNDLLG